MNIKKVKQGAQITFYNGIYLIILGIYFIFFSNFNMKTNFKTINQLWGFFSKFNSDIAYFFFLFNLLIGISFIANGIIIMYLSDLIYKRKEKMPWVVLFLFGIITWGSLLTITILLKNIILIALSFIGWLMFVIGMVLPIKYYLEKNYREY